MKPQSICLVGLLALIIAVPVCAAQDLDLGNVRFPRAFVHGGNTYPAGVYHMTLTEKEGVAWFQVSDSKGSLLIEEMGVVIRKQSRTGKRGFRLRREMLRGYEYFRVRVIQPERWVMAYFLVKN